MIKIFKIILILLLTFPILVAGQDTKEVKVKFPKSRQPREKFQVLKSDKLVKHGTYISYYKGNDKSEWEKFIDKTGNYINGEKDGLWIIYKSPKNTSWGTIKKKEYYNAGKKVGIWETSKEGGKVMEQFDYDKNEKVEPKIQAFLKYPREAYENGIEGTVTISFKINSDCSISDIIIISGLGYGCDEAAIESIKEFRGLKRKYSIEKECEATNVTVPVEFVIKK